MCMLITHVKMTFRFELGGYKQKNRFSRNCAKLQMLTKQYFQSMFGLASSHFLWMLSDLISCTNVSKLPFFNSISAYIKKQTKKTTHKTKQTNKQTKNKVTSLNISLLTSHVSYNRLIKVFCFDLADTCRIHTVN